MSGLDRIRDRSEAMTNENTFYKALEVASVQYACDEVHRIMNLNDDKDRYVPSSSMVMHVLRWLDRCHRNVWEHEMASPSDRFG